MAKKQTKPTPDQINAAAARDAMTLAAKKLDKQCGRLKLDEGSHAVALDIAVAGDVIVGKPTPPGQTVSVNGTDLAAALLGQLPVKDREKAAASALKLLARAEEGAAASKLKVDAGRGLVKATLDTAQDHGLVKPTAGRAGALTGKPSVRVAGEVAGNNVELDIAA